MLTRMEVKVEAVIVNMIRMRMMAVISYPNSLGGQLNSYEGGGDGGD